MKVSISRCRKLLGPLAVCRSDSEIKKVRDNLEVLAKIVIEAFVNEEKNADDINIDENTV